MVSYLFNSITITWVATLAVDYSRRDDRTVAHFVPIGPLRVLQSLHREGNRICHPVIVHPSGGLVGGDTLDLRFNAASGAHGLAITPQRKPLLPRRWPRFTARLKRCPKPTKVKLASKARACLAGKSSGLPAAEAAQTLRCSQVLIALGHTSEL